MLSLDPDSLGLLVELRKPENQDRTAREIVADYNTTNNTHFTADEAIRLQLQAIQALGLA